MPGSPPSQQILLIVPDLDERRLLLAELREAGYEVLPAPNADYAIRAVLHQLILPSLVLWDEHGEQPTMPEERQRLSSASERKGLVGSGDRSERIRTYNFPQGRVTDHRINLTLYKLDRIISGDDLGEIVDALVTEDQASRLAELEADGA